MATKTLQKKFSSMILQYRTNAVEDEGLAFSAGKYMG